MDRRSEALITEWIRAIRPGDTVLGEEGGQTLGGPRAADSAGDGTPVRWVVDPLDGTVNYLYGLPDWAVSIAAEVDGMIVAGVVEVPRFGETFTAVAGQGAWLRRGENEAASLHCNSGVALSQALVGTGFGYDSGRRQVQGEVVAALLPYVRDIRRGGSAAVDLCSVAAGRLDAFFERGLNYWDYAAGGLIAREAGAQVGGLSGRPESTSMTVAAGPDLFAVWTPSRPCRTRTRRGRGAGNRRPTRPRIGCVQEFGCRVCYRRNVTKFPAGNGHNYGLESVTTAQRLAHYG